MAPPHLWSCPRDILQCSKSHLHVLAAFAKSAAGILDIGSSINTYFRRRFQCSPPPSAWHWLKGLFSCNRQATTHKASVQESDQQPGEDAAAHTPFKINLRSVKVLRFKGPREDKPSGVVQLAGVPQAIEAVHPAAAKQGSAAEQCNGVQSGLLKAHRAEPADPVPHRAVRNGPAAEPDRVAQSDVKLNKRACREAKRAAKAAAAAFEGENDVLHTVGRQNGAALKRLHSTEKAA